MKNKQLLLSVILFLWTMPTIWAQSSIYFFYDPSCVQKLDYERLGTFPNLAFTDYVFTLSATEKLYLRVKKIAITKTITSKIPGNPFMCGDQANITPAVIKKIKNLKAVAYIITKKGNQFELSEVQSVATVEEAKNALTYKSEEWHFAFNSQKSKPNENLTKGLKAENRIYFELAEMENCLANRTFKVVSKHPADPMMHFNWLSGVGLQRIYTSTGEMRLVSINDISFTDYLVRKCSNNATTNTVTSTDKKENASDKTSSNPYSTGETTKDSLSPTDKALVDSKKKTPTENVLSPYSPPVADDDKKDASTKPKPQATAAGYYRVQEKDNLYTLSNQFNIPLRRLVAINGLQGYDIYRGQLLKVKDDASIKVPNQNPIIKNDPSSKTQKKIHVVQQGETLYSIAQKYGLTLNQIYGLNQLQSDAIDIDQQLVVGVKQLK